MNHEYDYERTSPVRRPGHAAIVVVLLAVVIGVALVLLQRNVFVLRNVSVEGNTRYSQQQVLEMSGLRQGQSIFALDQKEIARSLQEGGLLILESVYINYPNTLILHVHERFPKAALSRNGLYILLDELNIVLEIAGSLDPTLQIPVVTGMDAIRDDPGIELGVRIPAQLASMNEVLKELELQMVTARVSELNVTNLDNLYLVTKEGLIVNLGDSEQMEVKIGMMRAALDELKNRGMYSGTLDVSIPYTADYLEGRDPEVHYTTEPTAVPNELVGR